VGQRVIHESLLRKGRDEHKWLPRSVSAASLLSVGRRLAATEARTAESVRRGLRLMDDWAHLMVVPTIGVIVEDEDSRILPFRTPHEEVDRFDHERLFIQRIRVLGVTVLESGGLQERDLRHVARVHRIEEIVDVVLMIRAICEPDAVRTRWPGVVGIARAREILERLVMGYVVDLGHTRDRRRR